MTQVTVLVFGPLRDRLGVREVAAQGATVGEVWDDLTRQFPAAGVITGIRPALNLTYCDWSAPVSSGDTVAFLPPVAGGSGAEPSTEPVHVAIVDEPIDVAAVMELATRGDGAIAVFVGRVRDHSDGHAVSRIEYEVYREMAEREMRAIATSLQARDEISAIAIVHRVGTLEVGEASVAIAVAAPHRGAAFSACHDAIDMIKQSVPVWKREHRDDGARWVDARHGHDEGWAATP
jgi:MoaE-MoaD fusion protein